MANAYKKAGVNIEAGYETVGRIKKHVQRTFRPEVMGGLGGFGGAIDLSQLNLKEPVLVSGTDGVGTKLMIAIATDRHDTVGIDAVAMCVNDIITQGAEPVYFLDYLACSALKPEKAEAIVKGIAEGCTQAGCALIGGETAEMPGMYDENDYDIAGFSVGAVEKSKMIKPDQVKTGDVLIGLASSGIHSNGFSLVRKLVADAGLAYSDTYTPEPDKTIGEVLLRPTKIYVKPVLELLKSVDVHGIAHITGGGFYENVPRMFPEGLTAELDVSSWKRPAVFDWLKQLGNLQLDDMYHTFNMGLGLILAVAQEDAEKAIEVLKAAGESSAAVVGKVLEGQELTLVNVDEA
ncbi:phosphoribosylformylglycinamidine cyclo-ligase [Sporolactobacillus terrae]|uniref:Phosphoribosylformylglycinamidine cyclo-ligase n=1 Tax=Sporolactobacillus terrae TaxID=269673 RepID=A0ABX5Q9Y5_9BACL|nr:phosphoribosylformylglycinamidine cyclo-ligase [Sporolactobacillus terrae]QAA23445.1 phosphoribosylformylglycinamidine cyclo-ligase [Sporolactobacillus terrae]QAA26415.1 phosphoribosylformylglycinamidine cyclo-ligase [Sporolactobacillus terrae]UAK15509.1 phosphoribosylformylglycinamidine cyclo-ligase [Sporolactobacillus terrae]